MNLNDFKDAIKKEGLRLTQARVDIYTILYQSKTPLTPKEIFEKLAYKKTTKADLASVYRNLTVFQELHLVHQFQDGKFKNCDHNHKLSHDEHHHIHILNSCTKCKSISEKHDHSKDVCKAANDFTKKLSSLKKINEIVIYGLCPKCSHL